MSGLETGLFYYHRGFYSAAYEAWLAALDHADSPSTAVRIVNCISWIFFNHRMTDEALRWCSYPANHFAWDELTVDDWVRTTNNIAAAHHRNQDYDLALHTALSVMPIVDQAEPMLQAAFYLNLSAYQYKNEMYHDMVLSTAKCLELTRVHRLESFLWRAHTNAGLACMRLGQLDLAEYNLRAALDAANPAPLQTLVEVTLLYKHMGNWELCYQYAQTTSEVILRDNMSVEQGEYASLLEVLGHLSMMFGDRKLARQFFQKAELYYGAFGMWREWQDIQQVQIGIDTNSLLPSTLADHTESLVALRNWYEVFNLYDAMVSQFPQAGRLADFGSPLVKAMCDLLALDSDSARSLHYACRLQYFGWTTIDQDVVKRRNTSESAWKQYNNQSMGPTF